MVDKIVEQEGTQPEERKFSAKYDVLPEELAKAEKDGRSKLSAYKLAFPSQTSASAQSNLYRLLRDPKLKRRIDEEREKLQEGLKDGKNYNLGDHILAIVAGTKAFKWININGWRQERDWPTRLKYIQEINQILGLYAPKEHHIEGEGAIDKLTLVNAIVECTKPHDTEFTSSTGVSHAGETTGTPRINITPDSG